MVIFFLIFFLVIYLASFCLLIATGYSEKYARFGVIAKSLASVSFVGIALASVLVFIMSAPIAELDMLAMNFFYITLPAFLLCLVGDVLLELNHKDERKRFFLPGLVAFLLGHVTFVIAFNRLSPFSWLELIIPAAAVILTFFLTRLKDMDTGKMKPYVLIYSFFVAWLLSKGIFVLITAFQAGGAFPSKALFIAIGSALFFISDVIILFMMFYKKKYKHTRFFNLLTYYGAQLFLTLSFIFSMSQ